MAISKGRENVNLAASINKITQSIFQKTYPRSPIGIFDSGLGGLTVLRYLLEHCPNNEFVYLGDLANLPYGNKSENNIIDYSIKCAHFLEISAG